MMRVILLLAMLVAAGETHAARTIEYVEGAYELTLADVDMPTGTLGTLSVRPCGGCDRVSMTVNAATQYSFWRAPRLPLAEFVLALDRLRQVPHGADNTGIGVYYDLQTKRVTRVIVLSTN